MSDEREALAQIIYEQLIGRAPVRKMSWTTAVADAILAEGFRRAPGENFTIRTQRMDLHDELDTTFPVCADFERFVRLSLAGRRPGETGTETEDSRFVTQTITGDDGNCLAAAVATVLGCALAEVPDVTGANEIGWSVKIAKFCESRGRHFMTVDADDPPKGLAIAVGPSSRKAGNRHAVVTFDGLILWDVHPSRDFFGGKRPEYFFDLTPLSLAVAPSATQPEESNGTR